MAWLKRSLPSTSGVAEAFLPGGLARLATACFVERGFVVFFAETFLPVGFFIDSSVDIARPGGASIVGGIATVKLVNDCWERVKTSHDDGRSWLSPGFKIHHVCFDNEERSIR